MTIWVGMTPGYTIAGAHQESAKVYASMVDGSNYTSGSPLSLVPGTVIGSTQTGTGVTQQFLITQLSVNSQAVRGAKTGRGAWYRYDEV